MLIPEKMFYLMTELGLVVLLKGFLIVLMVHFSLG